MKTETKQDNNSLFFIQIVHYVHCVSICFIFSMTLATWTGFSDSKGKKGSVSYEMQFSGPKISRTNMYESHCLADNCHLKTS